jgi:hypothetical protein
VADLADRILEGESWMCWVTLTQLVLQTHAKVGDDEVRAGR